MSRETNISSERIRELMSEPIALAPYDPQWPERYAEAVIYLQSVLPADLVLRIDHIGSTAITGCSAKPVIDVQVEVTSLERVRMEVVPVLEADGHEFIWRPTIGEEAPFYAWFIRRNAEGRRTHHFHCVEPDAASEDRRLFRDALRADPGLVAGYEALKRELSEAHPNDRAAYTKGKTRFVTEVVANARGGAIL